MNLKIGYQGILGSFSSIAAQSIFKNEKYFNYLTFNDVIKNIENKNLDYGILPIENSTTGTVGMVLDELFHANVYINSVYDLSVVQNLVGVKGTTLKTIKQVYSHEQALMQCSKFLNENNYELISYANTALATRHIKEMNDITKAAVASDYTAKLYDLEIIKENINDVRYNYTRFVAISKKLNEKSTIFSFMFTVIDGSGALASILSEIALRKINLLAITSRSIANTPWKYYFYCEAEGDISDKIIKELINVLNEKCEVFKIVGAY